MLISDIYQLMTAVKNDADDTRCKLLELAEIVSTLTDAVDSGVNQEFDVMVEQFHDCRTLIGDGKVTFIGNKPISIVYKDNFAILGSADKWHGVQFVSQTGLEAFIAYNLYEEPTIGWWSSGDTEVAEYVLTSASRSYDFDIAGQVLRFGSMQFNLTGVVNTLQQSLEGQDILASIAELIGGKLDLVAFTSKWNLVSISANAKELLDDFLSKGSYSKDSMIQWLASMYGKLTTVTYNSSEDELSFDSDDHTVVISWNTVASGVISGVSSIVSTIATAIGGVAGVIAAVASAIGSMIPNLWAQATNPLLEVDATRRLAWNYSFAQCVGVNDREFANLRSLGSCTIDFPLVTMRYWYQDDLDHVELFLKPLLSYEQLRVFFEPYVVTESPLVDSHVYTLVEGISYVFSTLQNQGIYSPGVIGVQQCSTEGGQAMLLAANLYLVLTALGLSYNVTWTNNGQFGTGAFLASIYSRLKNGAGTVQDRFNDAMTALRNAWWGVTHDSQINIPTDGNNITNTVLSQWCDWEKLCNFIMPALRAGIGIGDFKLLGDHTLNFFYAYSADNQDQNLNANSDAGATCELDCPTARTYGISTPRNSSSGFILGMVVTLVTVAAVTAVAVAATIKIRRAINKKRLTKMAKAQSAYQTYQLAATGCDVNDSTGNTPHTYTKQELDGYFKDYYKSYKSYNRWSFLWGGSQFSFINGWDDGTPDASVGANTEAGSTGSRLLSAILPTAKGQMPVTTEDIYYLICGSNPSVD